MIKENKMKAASIIILVDPQNGFARDGLTAGQGGSLYVPDGGAIAIPAARLIRQACSSTIILSQDFHPSNHISFASNHAGASPMSEIFLKRGDYSLYQVVDGPQEGAFRQTLWSDHCIQGTESALFLDMIMDELPRGLNNLLRQPVSLPVLTGADDRGNTFYVIRKGARTDLDSYGIAIENDGVSTTSAPFVFNCIANGLKASGLEEADISIGGLATNFCVEFSHKDIYEYLVPMLNLRGMKTRVGLMTDVSRGIPIPVPGGEWPDLDAAVKRMAAIGTVETTTEEVISAMHRNYEL
jgi:nicotinamidase/pyrazinamidase